MSDFNATVVLKNSTVVVAPKVVTVEVQEVGAQGPKGDTGPQGEAATVSMRAGTVPLVNGQRTMLNSTVTNNSVILFNHKSSPDGNFGFLTYSINPGVSFTINSTNSQDNSTIAFLIVEATIYY